MSLARQFGIGFFVIFLLMFIGTLWVNTNNTRDFIQQQLASHAQDTATFLGLSITPYVDDEANIPIIETMINAVFDRGYYQSIQLTDPNGVILLDKINPKAMQSVPEWFINMFVIKAPVAATNLNTGWKIAGTLKVISNPGFGYEQLWRNAIDTFWVVFAIFILAMSFVWTMVRLITRPLIDVAFQVEAISNKNFGTVENVPSTPELSTVVNAVNRMSTTLSKMSTQLSEQSEKYRQFAYSDLLTNVGNRRAFELALMQILTDSEQNSQGFLLIVRCSSLVHVNNAYGGNVGDSYLISMTQAIKKIASQSFSHFNLYRLNNSDFSLIIEGCSKDECTAFLEELSTTFLSLKKTEYEQGTTHIGATEFLCGEDIQATMEKVDSALAIASTASTRWQLSSSLSNTQGNEVWHEKVQNVIYTGTADFAKQSIVSKTGNVLYQEWFARLPKRSPSEFLPMAQSIPASVRLDYAEKLDKLILTEALIKIPLAIGLVGINISRISLLNPDFQEWLLSKLSQSSQVCAKLVLEIPERTLVNDTNNFSGFVRELKHLGVKITVERFGAQFACITHLRDIRPDYLKLDGRFIRHIQNAPDNQLFVQSLVAIAHGLNIEIIAEMVESLEEFEWLKNAGIDFQQGCYISAPKENYN
jgi:EAL domain-containing protein (putative c-di-GMP-specific phosphodiesterase class I)/GGDEF domain-containing protein